MGNSNVTYRAWAGPSGLISQRLIDRYMIMLTIRRIELYYRPRNYADIERGVNITGPGLLSRFPGLRPLNGHNMEILS